MTLRLTAPSEDILGANYKITKIVASDYNPNIDSTITVTVTVKDVYDDPVENESVQVTCNIGKFTKLNGSTISDTQSVTGNTDSNGQFTLTYSCSEWGLATFSANNTNNQINVTGWRTVVNDSNYLIKYNDKLVSATIKSTDSTSYSTTYAEFGADILKDGAVDLRPLRPMSVIQASGNIVMIKDNSYRFGKFRISGTGTGESHAHFTYERR